MWRNFISTLLRFSREASIRACLHLAGLMASVICCPLGNLEDLGFSALVSSLQLDLRHHLSCMFWISHEYLLASPSLERPQSVHHWCLFRYIHYEKGSDNRCFVNRVVGCFLGEDNRWHLALEALPCIYKIPGGGGNRGSIYRPLRRHSLCDITQADNLIMQSSKHCSWCVEHRSTFALQREFTLREQSSPPAVRRVQPGIHRSVCIVQKRAISSVLFIKKQGDAIRWGYASEPVTKCASPLSLILLVLSRVREKRLSVILIAPYWTTFT